MSKKYLKQLGSTIFILFAVCILSIFSGCSEVKTIDFVPGNWSAENLQVGETEISKITLTVTESYEDGDVTIKSNGSEYGLSINLSGSIMDIAVTYYSKGMHCSFEWKNQTVYMDGEMKQDSESTYIEAGITIGDDSITFTMN